MEIAHRIVWCTLATVDDRGRPRSRLVHPVGAIEPGASWSAASRPTAARPKSAHLAGTPFASCSYWDPAHDVAVAECGAAWDEKPERSWHVFSDPPAPVGFDPAAMFAGGLGSPDAGVIVLRPWRLRWGRAADLAAGRPHSVWTARVCVS